MNDLPLIRAVLESVVFLGMSDDNIVDPDAALSQLEAIAAILKEWNAQDRSNFLNRVQDLADEEEAATGRTKRVEFLLSLCDNLGLT
jgi:predicted ATP-grasp superfamily ATP-dependent carboligase